MGLFDFLKTKSSVSSQKQREIQPVRPRLRPWLLGILQNPTPIQVPSPLTRGHFISPIAITHFTRIPEL